MEIAKTEDYHSWFIRLRDRQAKARINARLRRIELSGQILGDFKVFGQVIELRFHFGPGYRLYATAEGNTFLLLLVGGDKSSQEADITKAQRMAEEWRKQR
jgi:putative addiction module killer protein